jgi:hypothetical protein
MCPNECMCTFIISACACSMSRESHPWPRYVIDNRPYYEPGSLSVFIFLDLPVRTPFRSLQVLPNTLFSKRPILYRFPLRRETKFNTHIKIGKSIFYVLMLRYLNRYWEDRGILNVRTHHFKNLTLRRECALVFVFLPSFLNIEFFKNFKWMCMFEPYLFCTDIYITLTRSRAVQEM